MSRSLIWGSSEGMSRIQGFSGTVPGSTPPFAGRYVPHLLKGLHAPLHPCGCFPGDPTCDRLRGHSRVWGGGRMATPLACRGTPAPGVPGEGWRYYCLCSRACAAAGGGGPCSYPSLSAVDLVPFVLSAAQKLKSAASVSPVPCPRVVQGRLSTPGMVKFCTVRCWTVLSDSSRCDPGALGHVTWSVQAV